MAAVDSGVSATLRLDGLLHDLRAASRALLRARWNSVLVVAFLVLGVGANTAVFSLFNELLWRQPPVAEPDRLVSLWLQDLSAEYGTGLQALSWPLLEALREETHTLVGVAAAIPSFPVAAVVRDTADQIVASPVDAAYFEVLGLRPSIGRFFTAPETTPPREEFVAVISHDLWVARFERGSETVGSVLELEGADYRIVGVAPEAFRGVSGPPVDIWIPIPLVARLLPSWDAVSGGLFSNPDGDWLYPIGRIEAGNSIAAVREELAAIGGRHLSPADRRPRLTAFSEIRHHPRESADLRRWTTFAATITVGLLLVASANVAGLAMARSLARRREIAVRVALGCPRPRLVRQLLLEALLLVAVASATVLVFLAWLRGTLVQIAPYWPWGEDAVATFDAGPGLTVVLFVAALGLVTAPVLAIGAARSAVHSDPMDSLKGQGADRRSSKGLRALVILQFALSVALLAGGAMLWRSYDALRSADPGFDPEHLLLVFIGPEGALDAERAETEYPDLVEWVRSAPGVEEVSYASQGPGGAGMGALSVRDPATDGVTDSQLHLVGPEYFRAAGIPLVLGSDPVAARGSRAPAGIVINETLAGRLGWTGNAIGQQLRVGRHPAFGTGDFPAVVVGVARDAANVAPGVPVQPTLWAPFATHPGTLAAIGVYLHIRGGDPASLARLIRDHVDRTPTLQPLSTHTGSEWRAWFYARQQKLAVFAGFLAATALALAALGAYAAMTGAWLQRRREVGIRMAVGSSRSGILRLVLTDGLSIALTALPFGFLPLLVLRPWFTGQLHGISAYDPFSIGVVVAGTILAAIVASAVPAWSAARTDPVAIIRE